ncbi:MAG: SoxY-related AACIE arm protein [Gammaproteobacteria bacterium]
MKPRTSRRRLTRRELIARGNGVALALLLSSAKADPEGLAAAIAEFTGGRAPSPQRVTLDIPPLVENGNSVPATVTVESPMSQADYVRRIALFAQKNPQPLIAVFTVGPRSGRAKVSIRFRLRGSQQVVAVAELSDGSYCSASAEVLVTLAACVESEPA